MNITYFKTCSLCVLGICSSTLITFSQTSNKPPKPELNTTAQRVLTATDGKTIVVRLVDKTQDGLNVIRISDGKRVNIPLDRLCNSDQALLRAWQPNTASNYRPSSVSIAGNASLTRRSYPSAYQPHYSSGGYSSGEVYSSSGGKGGATKRCTLVSKTVTIIPGCCPTARK